MTAGVARFDALVLAGGEARRLGGASKPEVEVGGRALLDHVLDATATARHVVVVGPESLARPGVPTVREHPPSGGPVAGIEAGLTFLDAASGVRPEDMNVTYDDGLPVLVLACDVPQAALVVPALVAALAAALDSDGVQLVDADGHAQLVALYRRRPLRAALDRLVREGGVHGVSVRRMVDGLRMVGVPDVDGLGTDADTWDDVARLDRLIGRRSAVDEQSQQHPAGSEIHRWVLSAGDALGVDPQAVDVEALLDLARDVAHGVARPAVPLTSFLAGYAVAAGGGDRAAFERVLAQVTGLVQDWSAQERDATS